ncbi:Rz1-like lysis system protein LysC [Escherichia coli]|uniref:Rz1-like lysis system protein LysC n=1 Tax=Escherichia coli TaxID=562 RepID=UPI002FBF08E1
MLCAGCTSARPAPTPVIVANACPKVSLCPMPGSDPQTNGDLSADIRQLEKLRSGIDWVLEKLGVINKESDTLDQTAARTHAATYGTGGYIPATSSYAGYQAYQPVTAPAGRSYVDQSKNEYHINLTGGTAQGTQLDRQLQDALEKYERDKRARARASMMHDG